MNKFQTILFLIRHGQASPRLDSVTQDFERVLTSQGRGDVKKVGEYLANFPVEKIYSSPLTRTVQTAEVVREAINPELEMEIVKGLAEIYNQGDYDNLEQKGENTLINIVRQHSGKQVAVVSHQLVIETLLKELGATQEMIKSPCQQGEFYRLVFADTTLVECQKISL